MPTNDTYVALTWTREGPERNQGVIRMGSMFKGAKDAPISHKGTKCADGTHLLEIKRITMSEGGNGTYYVVEFKVLETNSTDKVGDERVWTQSMKSKQYYFPACKKFLFAAMGFDTKNNADNARIEAEINPLVDDLLEQTLDESDPLGLTGRRVKAVTKKKLTEANFDFWNYDFSPGQADKLF